MFYSLTVDVALKGVKLNIQALAGIRSTARIPAAFNYICVAILRLIQSPIHTKSPSCRPLTAASSLTFTSQTLKRGQR